MDADPKSATLQNQRGFYMNQKEISELRRRWGYEKNAVSRIYGCFVNGSKEIVSNLDESLGAMSQAGKESD